MKKLLLFVLTFLFISALFADQIAFQGFEGSDSWNYTADPASFDENSHSDVWAVCDNLASISGPATGTYFWGIRDLKCPANNAGTGNLDFNAIDVSSYSDVVLTFKYYSHGFDASDSLRYQVQYDNGTTWPSADYVDCNKSTDAWTTVTINVPSGTNYVRLRLRANQNGGSDEAAWDDIELTGTPAGGVGDPSNFTSSTVSTSEIDLSWSLNSSSDNVMLVYNTSDTFGTPSNGTSYSVGNTIPGGGEVIYKGSDTSYNHTGLTDDTHYYYKLFSYDASNNYSSGVTTNAKTYMNVPVLYVNELQPVNNTTITDEHGDYDDWIEIYNPTSSDVNIGGYYMTDDLNNPAKYQIPTTEPDSTTLPAGGYLILWADNETAEGVRHLGFGLSGSGEDVGLYGSDGFTPVDTVTFPSVQADDSYARENDGTSTWTTFFHPTPNATNNTSYIQMTMPNGGEIWEQGVSINITWSNQNFTDNVDIDLYKGTDHWMDVATDISNSSPYAWTIPDTLTTGNDYKMYIQGHSSTSVNDYSNDAFQVIAAGSAPQARDIIINEIMYNTPSYDDEWIELYNTTDHSITLSNDWKLEYGSMSYTFDGTLTIASHGYITVAVGSHNDGTFNPDNPFTPDAANCTIDNSGTDDTNHLSNSSATIKVIYGTSTINEVTYDDGSPWPTSPDGHGPSLERIDPTLNDDTADNFNYSFDDGGTPDADNQYESSATAPADGATSQYGKLPGGGNQFELTDGSGGTTITLNDYTIYSGRMHSQLGGKPAIGKYIHIDGTPSDATTITLYYTDNEFNDSGIASEDNLALAAWDGSGWHVYSRGAGSDAASNKVTADNITSFSDWVIIDATDPPLPVVLSAFYAEFNANELAIVWTTESEENLLGWNVYRGSDNSLENAERVNPSIIDAKGSATQSYTYRFIDSNVSAGASYYYWLESVEYSGISTFTEPIKIDVPNNDNNDTPQVNEKYGLYQNYPNPFNPSTTIRFKLKKDSKVSLEIYNIKGQKVKTLYNDYADSDKLISKTWNGTDDNNNKVANGVYFYKLIYNGKVESKKMIMLK